MRGIIFLVALAATGWAQTDDDFIGHEVDTIVSRFHEDSARRQPTETSGAHYEKWLKERESLRKAAVKKVDELIDQYGPRGASSKRDTSAACRALLQPPLAPRGAALRALALRLLLLDPKSPDCWSYLQALRRRFRSERGVVNTPWAELRAWALETKRLEGVTDEAARALHHLLAEVAYEMGNPGVV